jgi:hypothetical protein
MKHKNGDGTKRISVKIFARDITDGKEVATTIKDFWLKTKAVEVVSDPVKREDGKWLSSVYRLADSFRKAKAFKQYFGKADGKMIERLIARHEKSKAASVQQEPVMHEVTDSVLTLEEFSLKLCLNKSFEGFW